MVVGRLDVVLTTVYKAQEKVIWTLRKPTHLISHFISTTSKKPTHLTAQKGNMKIKGFC